MIIRNEYRACLKPDVSEDDLKAILSLCSSQIKAVKEDGNVLAACLYRHERMLFLYTETLREGITPSDLFTALEPGLELWPEESGLTPWAKMYHIYRHSEPTDVESWAYERASNSQRIGRIAFLKPEKLFSYTYWHYAIVHEGLLKGDKYQYISLHENILFSYYEEPRHNVNLTGSDAPSKIIDGWMAADPESHFDHSKTGKSNFLVIDPVLIV